MLELALFFVLFVLYTHLCVVRGGEFLTRLRNRGLYELFQWNHPVTEYRLSWR